MPQRSPELPDVPTIAEQGLSGYKLLGWLCAFARTGTPPEIVRRLQEECLKALRSSAVTERFANDNAIGGGGPSSDYAAFVAREQSNWSEIVRRAAIRPD